MVLGIVRKVPLWDLLCRYCPICLLRSSGIGRSFTGPTGKPVHTYLLWFAAYVTCNIVVSQPKLTSDLAHAVSRLPANAKWLLKESGSGAFRSSTGLPMVRSPARNSCDFRLKDVPTRAVNFRNRSKSTSRSSLV